MESEGVPANAFTLKLKSALDPVILPKLKPDYSYYIAYAPF